MIRIDLDKAKPGMVLAKPVYNLQEMLLLKERVQLTERNIQVLRAWGIGEIWIDGDADHGEEQGAPDHHTLRIGINKVLEEKFANVADDPVMMEIMRLAGNQLERRLLKRDAEHGTPTS
jgi:hypothetical protein